MSLQKNHIRLNKLVDVFVYKLYASIKNDNKYGSGYLSWSDQIHSFVYMFWSVYPNKF